MITYDAETLLGDRRLLIGYMSDTKIPQIILDTKPNLSDTSNFIIVKFFFLISTTPKYSRNTS